MLRTLYQFSLQRRSWLLLVLTALILELIALYFQHGMEMAPCVYCIYQRCAIWGIFLAGLVGAIFPKHGICRFTALAIWGYAAFEGYQIALRHVELQFRPSFLNLCPLDVSFPSWLPLNHWFPSLFQSSGSCAERVWQFLSLEMSQWMLVIFSGYLIVAAIILLIQLVGIKKA